ncbi:SulP family inorganic anion transporter [Rhizobium pusense]|uniref:SulP family inorganic anion transporter n=1 Tax=Agrobacterium pusense TaxID=648995 RepID=UPI001C6ED620|nr:SulP family inorganic anion transporter [Agrobacterium pusense]MBW9080703.1 SulP family inorganic anion transporter [Agrobacterium pusense]
MSLHATDDGHPSRSHSVKNDVVAGLVAAAVVLPKAMAYATVAGLPVTVGFYTAFLPMIIYACLGSSRVLSVSSTTTIAILTAAELQAVVPDGDPQKLVVATATFTALTGVLLLIASGMRLGFVANFISVPVLTGFKAGIGVVIILDQLPKLFGLHITKTGFFRDIFAFLEQLPETSIITAAVGLLALFLLLVVEKLRPHSPAPLAVVAGAILASWMMNLSGRGVATVGNIPQSLPSLTLPDLGLIMALLPGAIGVALMSFTETVAAGRAFANPSDPPIRPNRELLAVGAANLGGAFFGAMPSGGGTSQTAVVRAVGGRTQLASFVTAAVSVATMLVLAPFLGLLPQAALAAVVIVYSLGLIQPSEFWEIRQVRHMEFRWALAAFLGVLFFGTLQGIIVAIIVSLLGLSSQAANPKIHVIGRDRGSKALRPVSASDDETMEGLLILRPEGRLFFANVQQVADRIRAIVSEKKPYVLLLDLSRVFDIEYSAIQMLIVSDRNLAKRGVALWLANLNPDVLDYIRASGLASQLGDTRMFKLVDDGVRHFEKSARLSAPNNC